MTEDKSAENPYLMDYKKSLEEPDRRLYDLAVMVNGGYSNPITVSVNGIIYSGMMVGEKEWLEENLRLIELANEAPFSEENIDYYKDLIHQFDKGAPPRFLHMKEVNIISHPTANMPVFLWRIRLDKVDAFHLGRMP
ncbi:hypothetical protein [Providencia sp. PROV019]|uniref:hypothetical protein n=1 Tax=Providencia sp. PROV019 TaxID=2949754 RepID=UPI002349D284|nr:hypothetical protein [Providencia sp. PROV019]